MTKNITFATVNGTNYAYISQAETGTGTAAWVCDTDSFGVFTNCQTTGNDYSWSNIFDITVATFDHQYAYVVNSGAAQIVQCEINSTDGTFKSNTCTAMTPTGDSLASPSAVTFATFNGTQYAYVSDQNAGVFQCNIDQTTGDFLNCSSTAYSGSQDVFGVSFSTINNATYAYLSILSGKVWVCLTNNNGEFVQCAEQSPSFPDGLSFGNVFWTAFSGVN